MDLEQFLALITKVGENRIAGFSLNNSARRVFKKGEFTVAKCVDQTLKMLVLEEKDGMSGNIYTSYKSIADIEAVLVAPTPELVGSYDPRYIGG